MATEALLLHVHCICSANSMWAWQRGCGGIGSVGRGRSLSRGCSVVGSVRSCVSYNSHAIKGMRFLLVSPSVVRALHTCTSESNKPVREQQPWARAWAYAFSAFHVIGVVQLHNGRKIQEAFMISSWQAPVEDYQSQSCCLRKLKIH